MIPHFLDVLPKEKTARAKWNLLPESQREQISMSFICDLISSDSSPEIESFGPKTLPDGRTVQMVALRVPVGVFAFAIPEFMDSVMILTDFALSEAAEDHYLGL